MRKSLITTAIMLCAGVAQAQLPAVGDTTNNAVFLAGATTFPNGHFHGPNGAPGVGFSGPGGYIISLQSIDPFTGHGQQQVAGTNISFNKHQLLGYNHNGPGGLISAKFNWARVPGASSQAHASAAAVDRRVYFGLINNAAGAQGLTHVHEAFYTGDPTDRVVPTATTNYATMAFIALPTTQPETPIAVTGNLRYDAVGATLKTASLQGASGVLADANNDYRLSIDTNVSGSAFSGTSRLSYANPNGSVVRVRGSGNAVGQFFGSGNGSAVAGMAQSQKGASYTASFGGVKR